MLPRPMKPMGEVLHGFMEVYHGIGAAWHRYPSRFFRVFHIPGRHPVTGDTKIHARILLDQLAHRHLTRIVAVARGARPERFRAPRHAGVARPVPVMAVPQGAR